MKQTKKYIERSPGNIIELGMFIDDLNLLRVENWELKQWKPMPALIDRSGNKQLYTGQKFNADHFNLVEEGWNHDHCEMCIERIDNENPDGFTDGFLWLCTDCFRRFILPKSIDDIIANYKVIEK